jgi:hypothetical protein
MLSDLRSCKGFVAIGDFGHKLILCLLITKNREYSSTQKEAAVPASYDRAPRNKWPRRPLTAQKWPSQASEQFRFHPRADQMAGKQPLHKLRSQNTRKPSISDDNIIRCLHLEWRILEGPHAHNCLFCLNPSRELRCQSKWCRINS